MYPDVPVVQKLKDFLFPSCVEYFYEIEENSEKVIFFGNASWIEFQRKSSWSEVDLPARKPHFSLERRLLDSRNQRILKLTIFSNNLQRTDVREIGRKLSINIRFLLGFGTGMISPIFHEFGKVCQVQMWLKIFSRSIIIVFIISTWIWSGPVADGFILWRAEEISSKVIGWIIWFVVSSIKIEKISVNF